MKLFLSSYQIGNAPEALCDLIGNNKRVGLIMNATDPFGNERRPQYVAKYVAAFAELGLAMEELDLRDYFEAPRDLETKVAEYGALWASGGNTFALRWAMGKSGFDVLLPKLLARSDLVYGGFSAGACVLSPTLEGTELIDDPSKVPEGELNWQGLGLVDFCIAPHYRSDHPESPAVERLVEYFKRHQMRYVALHDGEALRVVDGRVDRVGSPSKGKND